MIIKTINQSMLTSECWSVQMFGFEKCKDCEYKDTSECGGQNIIKIGKNDEGYNIPLENK